MRRIDDEAALFEYRTPNKNWPAKTRDYGPYPVPVGATSIEISMIRDGWPDTAIASLLAEITYDGIIWNLLSKFDTTGGAHISTIDGSEHLFSSAWGDMREPDNTLRQLRVTAINSESIKTEVAVGIF